MPLRAFIDSDKVCNIGIASYYYVLMPLRAFIDSDQDGDKQVHITVDKRS